MMQMCSDKVTDCKSATSVEFFMCGCFRHIFPNLKSNTAYAVQKFPSLGGVDFFGEKIRGGLRRLKLQPQNINKQKRHAYFHQSIQSFINILKKIVDSQQLKYNRQSLMNLSFKNNITKKILILLTVVAALILVFVLYQKKIRYNLVTISENKVYNSGAVPPEKLADVVSEYKIKTIIDLLDSLVQTALNPETKKQVNAEEYAAGKIAGVHYFNLPTDQIPEDRTVQEFLKIMDNPGNYPVLIHCHHGVGRSRLFSSIYRIEYENFTNENARAKARLFWELGSNFSKSSEKGIYLMNYKKRGSVK